MLPIIAVIGEMKNINKDVLLLLKDDTIKDEALKIRVQTTDDKVKQMLLWSTICSVWSYLVFIVVIIRIYVNFHGQHALWLFGSLAAMYTLMAVFIWFAWKNIARQQSHFHFATRSYFKYQANKLTCQRKLIVLYLLEYGLLLSIAGIFFLWEVPRGLSILLKLTIPVSAVTYVLGIYFLFSLTRQIRKFKAIQQQVSEAVYNKNINQN
jgi:hypothetical protein